MHVVAASGSHDIQVTTQLTCNHYCHVEYDYNVVGREFSSEKAFELACSLCTTALGKTEDRNGTSIILSERGSAILTKHQLAWGYLGYG